MRTIPYGRGALGLPDAPFRLDVPEVPPPPPSRGSAAPSETQAFDRPIGVPGVAEVFRGARRVLVVVSDRTRNTGASRFLPELLERIRAAAGAGAEIRFAVASGIHRPPQSAEIEEILGAALASRHEVLRHDPDAAARLVALGRTSGGTPVRVNAAVREHDRLVLTGAVTFHYYAGFTGGRKAVVPGLAARETVVRNHLRALRADGSRHPAARAGNLSGNPVHRDMTEGAALTRPDLLVNSVIGEAGEIERLFVGHWRRAHGAACRYVRRTRTVRLVPRDLVVVSAGGFPTDLDLIQAHKGFEAAYTALRAGGTLVLVAECPRGAGHPDFARGFEPGSEEAMVARLRERFTVYGQTALSWFRKARRCRLILVSSLAPDRARRLGAWPAAGIVQAFDQASRYHPRDTAGWVIPWGAKYRIEPVAGAEP